MLLKRASNINTPDTFQKLGLVALSETDHKILENMERFGGSFVKTLALLTRQASYDNIVKLRDTFSDFYEAYTPDKWGGKKHGR